MRIGETLALVTGRITPGKTQNRREKTYVDTLKLIRCPLLCLKGHTKPLFFANFQRKGGVRWEDKGGDVCDNSVW